MAEHPRRVTLHAEHRSVALDHPHSHAERSADIGDHDGRTEVSYPGILLTRLRGEVCDAQIWLPTGEHPSFADDEELIAALHQALRWAQDGFGRRG